MNDPYADLVDRFGDVIHEIPELGPAILAFEAREQAREEAAAERPRYRSGVTVGLSDRQWGEVQSVGCVFRQVANSVS